MFNSLELQHTYPCNFACEDLGAPSSFQQSRQVQEELLTGYSSRLSLLGLSTAEEYTDIQQ